MKDGQKLWLWKNGDHFLAYEHEYPTIDGGDPLTLGEPAAIAIFRVSDPPDNSAHRESNGSNKATIFRK